VEIRQIIYFTTVADEGSFTKAAEILHVTQPTLSKMVKSLEEELGVQLLDRSGKKVVMTDSGRAIYRSARNILQSMNDMKAQIRDVIQLKVGTLRLGLPPMVGGQFFPLIIERFHDRHPEIELILIERGSRKIEDAIVNGELDAGFIILSHPDDTHIKPFHTETFLNDQLMLVVDPEHRLASKKSVHLNELAQDDFVMFRQEFRIQALIMEACRQSGFEPRVVFESSQWDLLIGMVAAKLGVTLLPGRVCRTLDPTRYRIIMLEGEPISWNLSMIWSQDKYMSYATRAWVSFIQYLGETTRLQT
jgi:DNA-binding transcriptional LysR family regulator